MAEAAKWVAGVTGLDAHPEHAHAAPAEAIDGDVAALEQWLASGEVLCALAHRLGAEAARAVNAPNIDPSSSSSAAGAPAAASGEETISFYERSQRNAKRMEVVGRYLDAIRRIGVPEHDLFNSVDLVNGKDMRAVVRLSIRSAASRSASTASKSHTLGRASAKEHADVLTGAAGGGAGDADQIHPRSARRRLQDRLHEESPSTSASRQRAMASLSPLQPSQCDSQCDDIEGTPDLLGAPSGQDGVMSSSSASSSSKLPLRGATSAATRWPPAPHRNLRPPF